MKKITNSEGHLVAIVDELTNTVIIVRRGCETYIAFDKNGNVIITNVSATEKAK